jgi:hypothetical protein
VATITTTRLTYGYAPGTAGWDSSNEALDISGALDILRPVDVPLLSLIGRDSLRDPCTQVKHEWTEDEYRGMSTVMTAGYAATDPGIFTPDTAAHCANFRAAGGDAGNYTAADSTAAGDVVRISSSAGDEVGIVTAVGATTITVDRSQLGSTPVDHTGVPVTITIIGTMQPQGMTTVGSSRTTTKTRLFNYTQIFEDSFRASRTQQSTRKLTAQNDMANEMSKIMDLMGVQMERTLLFGQKQAPAATVAAQQGPAGAMGGIRSFISTNVYDKAGAQLTEIFLEDALEDQWEAGARSMLAFVNSTQKRVINTFMDTERRVDYHDTRLGRFVESFHTDFGVVSFVLDRHMPNNEVLLIDPENIGFGPLVGGALSMSKRPVESSEADLYQVVGEYTCEVRLEKSHAIITDLATTIPAPA